MQTTTELSPERSRMTSAPDGYERVARARRARRGLRRGWIGVAGAVGVVACAMVPDASAREARTLIAFEHTGMGAELFDEKDQALHRCLEMIRPRVKELKTGYLADTPFAEVPDVFFDLGFDLLTTPMRFVVTQDGFEEETHLPKIGVVMSYKIDGGKDDNAARAWHSRIEGLREMSGLGGEPSASTRFKGMQELELPFGILTYGPRKAADGWRYEHIFGAVTDPDAMFGALPATPSGKTMMGRGVVDLAAISPIVEMFAGMAAMGQPGLRPMLDQLEASGYIGENAMTMEFTKWVEGDKVASRIVMRGARQFREALMLPEARLTRGDLAIVPRDAYYASVSKMDLNSAWTQMRQQISMAMENAGEDSDAQIAKGLTWFREKTGVDFEQDILASLGDTFAVYISDTTGGNSLMAGVVAVELKNPARFARVLDRFAVKGQALAHEFGEHESRDEIEFVKRMRFARFDRDGVHYVQLRFAGLPIPFEPTIAVADGWLIVGATPQACVGGARAAMGGQENSLLLNETFMGAADGLEEVSVVSYVDMGRTMRDGYVMTSMLGSLLANGVRSQAGADRDPGMIVPTFGELSADVKPFLSFQRWEGDDFVTTMTADHSMLVGIAGVLGVGDIASLLEGAFLGASTGFGLSQAMQEAGLGHHNDWDHDDDDWDEDDDDDWDDEDDGM